jgi:hypothetical protein
MLKSVTTTSLKRGPEVYNIYDDHINAWTETGSEDAFEETVEHGCD